MKIGIVMDKSNIKHYVAIIVNLSISFYLAYVALYASSNGADQGRSFFSFINSLSYTLVYSVGQMPAAVIFVTLGIGSAYFSFKKISKASTN